MRHSFAVVGLTAFALLAICPAAQAQDDSAQASALDASRVKVNLSGLGYYTDNFYNQPNNEAAGGGTLIRPEISFLEESSKLLVAGTVDGEYGVFDLPGSEDDYLDGGARFRLVSQGTVRNQVRLGAALKHSHDDFGVNRTEDATVRDDELDRWNQFSGSLHFRYGAAGARLNAEVGLRKLDRHYITNRAATEPLNYEANTGEYALFYNYSPKTAALVDFSRTAFAFDRPFGAVDTRTGELYRARAGIRWLATGKTSGDVRIGYRRRTFDVASPDLEGLDWEATIDWAPVPRSQVKLTAARSEQESYRADTRVIGIDSLALGWKYNLSAKNRANLVLERLEADFDTSGRDDRIFSAAFTLEHVARRYLWVVASVGNTHRASSADFRDYDRLTAFLGLRLGR